jgi:Leucine-rich repeat (LRR) protein
MLFWLWLVILPTRVAIQCPEECRCKDDGYYLKYSDSGLNRIPSILPTHVRVLVLNGNSVNSSFVPRVLVDLQVLKADLCEVRKIEFGSFSELTKLIVLSMKGNKISEIIAGTFENISHLEYLRLDSNVIVNLESDVFDGLVNLKYISLKGNELQYLHPDTFVWLSNLQRFNLSQNIGLQIPSDRPFITSFCLKYLDISGCNIISVSLEIFSYIITLEWLDLS